MIEVASRDNNILASQWLKQKVLVKEKIVWVGYGLSYALAEAFAEIFRQMGIISWALTPSELETVNLDVHIGYVSRSGRELKRKIDFLVTQDGSDISWTNAPCLSVLDVDHGESVWLALDYTRETLLSFSKALGLCYSYKKYINHNIAQKLFDVIVFEQYSRPVQILFQASSDKLNKQNLLAIDCREIGHGFHYRLWSNPEQYVLYLCKESGAYYEWGELEKWAQKVQVQVNEIFLSDAPTACEKIVDIFCFGIDLIELFAQQEGISIQRKPLPDELDYLR